MLGSYGSIRNTLVHALSTEWGWLDRCGGAKRGPALKGEDFNERGRHSMPIGELLHHGASRAVHHSGQVALMLNDKAQGWLLVVDANVKQVKREF